MAVVVDSDDRMSLGDQIAEGLFNLARQSMERA